MVFSSIEFILLFLPITILVYYACRKYFSARVALSFLFLSSLFYYAYWNPKYLYIILVSIIFNYSIGYAIEQTKKYKKLVFLFGIIANISVLIYFKYTNFLLSNFYNFSGSEFTALDIVMPIGISFFTFQQIAYLSDLYKGVATQSGKGFLDYCLFVCFFPQLVAGPIVHHKEMMPQFAMPENTKIKWENIYWGLVLFAIGLTKKVVIADTLSPFVHHSFDVVEKLSFLGALVGSLAYTFQLYFDFSGYSDMAIGAALFFNIKLPFNFNSPYKATNIQDFWKRWHITLSRWLREYVYIPLGGNRRGNGMTLVNLFLTFLIGGIWHGAAWTFVVWGVLHGIAIAAHRVWNKAGLVMFKSVAIILTFIFVNFAWIFFRAINFDRVQLFLDGFMMKNGFYFIDGFTESISELQIIIFVIAIVIVFLMKNSKEIYDKGKPSALLSVFSVISFLVIMFTLAIKALDPSLPQGEFIYFQF